MINGDKLVQDILAETERASCANNIEVLCVLSAILSKHGAVQHDGKQFLFSVSDTAVYTANGCVLTRMAPASDAIEQLWQLYLEWCKQRPGEEYRMALYDDESGGISKNTPLAKAILEWDTIAGGIEAIKADLNAETM